MKYSIVCNAKGCQKLQAPYIDQKTNKVHCSECDVEMPNISPFIVRQMVSNKQFKEKEKQSFAVKCNSCQADQRPLLVNGKIICSSCKKELAGLNPTFALMLKQNLQNADKEII